VKGGSLIPCDIHTRTHICGNYVFWTLPHDYLHQSRGSSRNITRGIYPRLLCGVCQALRTSPIGRLLFSHRVRIRPIIRSAEGDSCPSFSAFLRLSRGNTRSLAGSRIEIHIFWHGKKLLQSDAQMRDASAGNWWRVRRTVCSSRLLS